MDSRTALTLFVKLLDLEICWVVSHLIRDLESGCIFWEWIPVCKMPILLAWEGKRWYLKSFFLIISHNIINTWCFCASCVCFYIYRILSTYSYSLLWGKNWKYLHRTPLTLDIDVFQQKKVIQQIEVDTLFPKFHGSIGDVSVNLSP